MSSFDAEQIAKHGWRQGAVLGQILAEAAQKCAPETIAHASDDWLIVTSHDCDIVNFSLGKEPVVEVLRGAVLDCKAAAGPHKLGRNPRILQLSIKTDASPLVLECKIHERWNIPRELLMQESPTALLPGAACRLIAEWLAKRYIRAAFPSTFDVRWRSNLKAWTKLLARYSQWIQGVYLRLNTMNELEVDEPYRCHMMVAVPEKMMTDPNWAAARDEIDREVSTFWSQFKPGIHFDGCEVLGTDEITLADLELYQRFDADWVSYADDSARTPLDADMLT